MSSSTFDYSIKFTLDIIRKLRRRSCCNLDFIQGISHAIGNNRLRQMQLRFGTLRASSGKLLVSIDYGDSPAYTGITDSPVNEVEAAVHANEEQIDERNNMLTLSNEYRTESDF